MDLNYSERYPRRITLEGKKLTVERVPNSEDYKYLMLVLEDQNGNTVLKEIAESVAGKDAVFYLRNLSANRLNVKLYRSAQRSSTYPAVMYGKDVQLDWDGTMGSFVMYPYYEHNMSVLTNKRMEWRAQEFYTQPSEDIQSDAQEIKDLAASITEGLTDNYDKAAAIYTWVCNNIYYDYDAYYKKNDYGDTSALGTLRSRRSVCEGYSNLFAALLRAAGIPAKKISGFALGLSNENWPENLNLSEDTNHAWNEAFINGRWVIMDSTWGSDNEWRDGKISKSDGIRGYHYFDISPDLFSADHVIREYKEDHVPQPQ